MIYYQNTMPYKLTLVHKQTDKKYTFYKSVTEFLSYDDTKFDAHIQHTKEQKSD